MSHSPSRGSLPGWILVAGVLLATLGLSLDSRAQDEVDPPVDSPIQDLSRYAAGAYGTSDSNRTMIAVTGVDVTGGSLLFLIDTEGRQLSVYQAQGGTGSMMRVEWVAARNIDLDLQVDGWRDKSDYTYKELAAQFEKQGSISEPKR